MKTKKNAWLIKSEPSVYPWSKLVTDGSTRWDGIRSYEARNNLRAMKLDDVCLFYHSNEGKEIVGIALVTREAYADPTSDEPFVERSMLFSRFGRLMTADTSRSFQN